MRSEEVDNDMVGVVNSTNSKPELAKDQLQKKGEMNSNSFPRQMLIACIIHVSVIQICFAPPFHLTKFELLLLNQSGLTNDQKECRISVPA